MMILTSGCASVFTGTTDIITFDSTPKGADVQINGMKVGRTPLTLPVKRSLSAPQVKLKHKNYESQYVMLDNTFNTIAILDIFFWPTFFVDAATGSLMKHDILYYDVDLEPKKAVR